jgi:hypothetical protein
VAQIDGQPDHAAPRLKTDGVSPKAIVSTVIAALVGVLVAALNAVQADPSLLGPLPTWVQGVILAVVPAAITFLSAYRAGPGNVVEDR